MRFWRRRTPVRAISPARAKPRYFDVHIHYQDGTVSHYERVAGVYPVGEHGSHLRIELPSGSHSRGSFIIISLSGVVKVEGTEYEEETESGGRSGDAPVSCEMNNV